MVKVLKPPYCLVQMETHFSLIKMLSWKGGQNTLIARPIARQLPMYCQKVECNILLDEFPTVKEQKYILHLSSDKALGSDAILVKINKASEIPMEDNLTESFQCMWRM